ncbi:LysR family transcriptional regulator [Vibrio renipiscarius]|nr:LysR family transcriptional regulator [Vibrio renipiscarius]
MVIVIPQTLVEDSLTENTSWNGRQCLGLYRCKIVGKHSLLNHSYSENECICMRSIIGEIRRKTDDNTRVFGYLQSQTIRLTACFNIGDVMDIEAVRMFVALAGKLNFTETSRLLQVSQPTLSRKIKMLEESLSVTLVHRRGGHISLTPQGETFLIQSESLLEHIDRTIALVQSEQQDESGIIRIGCLHPMAKFITDNFIVNFNKKYPHIAVHFKTMIPRTLNSFEEVDIMVAPFWPEDDSVVAKKLPANRRYCFASPQYLAEFGTPEDIKDLSHHHCVTQTNAVKMQKSWTLQNKQGHQEEVAVTGMMASDSTDITIELIKKGFGIGLSGRYKAAEGRSNGELVELFDGEWFTESNMYILYKQNPYIPRRFKIFIKEFTKVYTHIIGTDHL